MLHCEVVYHISQAAYNATVDNSTTSSSHPPMPTKRPNCSKARQAMKSHPISKGNAIFLKGHHMRLKDKIKQAAATGYILLWLLGVPIPILFVIFLLRGCT
jgi:hypothetical protein